MKKRLGVITKVVISVALFSLTFCSMAFAEDQLFSEATIYANGSTVYNSSAITSGVTAGGKGYGLARIADFLSTQHGEIEFVSADHIDGNIYAVTTKGGDDYSNGTFSVTVFPSEAKYQKVLPGYQFWYGIHEPVWKFNVKKGVYERVWEMVGVAQGIKLQGTYVGR